MAVDAMISMGANAARGTGRRAGHTRPCSVIAPKCRALVLISMLFGALPASGQVTASSQPAGSVERSFATALQWVSKPDSENPIEAFSPALDMRYRVYTEPKPLRIWIARIDLTVPGVRLAVTEPVDFTGDDAKFETRCANTLEFARQRGVQLACNSSAFAPFRAEMGMPMDVVGLAAAQGKVYSTADERFGAMFIAPDRQVSLKGPPLDAKGVRHVVAGFRMLLDDQRLVVSAERAQSGFGGINPRTAVGVDRDGRTLWIVVADGRQEGVSEGVTLVELAALFQSLGAWDALNLDGGGSSTLVCEGRDRVHRVVNTPVGRGAPGTLRQVANNLGFYLPGIGPPAGDRPLATLREFVTARAAAQRGGGYKWAGDGVSKDIAYDGVTILRANPEGTFCCGATLETFLDAYCLKRNGHDSSSATGRWFEGWPRERLLAMQKGWWGTEDAVTHPLIPAEARPTIREKQVYHALPGTGLAKPVDDYRLLQRGDFVQFWRTKKGGHSVIFWGRDRDEKGRERLWYWSSQGKPRYAYPREPGGKPVTTPGYGVNWEYIGDEIDPKRIYGAALLDTARE